jgi:hypothetical protein
LIYSTLNFYVSHSDEVNAKINSAINNISLIKLLPMSKRGDEVKTAMNSVINNVPSV